MSTLLNPSVQLSVLNKSIQDDGNRPVITFLTPDVSVVEGAPVTLCVNATGGNLSYQWQVSLAGSVTFNNVEGSTDRCYSIESADIVDTGNRYRVLVSNKNGITYSMPITVSISVSIIERLLVIGSGGQTMELYDYETLTYEGVVNTPPVTTPNNGSLSKSGAYATINGGGPPYLNIYNVATQTRMSDPAVAPDGFLFGSTITENFLAAGGSNGKLWVYNFPNRELLFTLDDVAYGLIRQIRFTPDGQHMVIGFSTPPYLEVRETTTWTVVPFTGSLSGGVLDMSFSSDGTLFAVGHSTTPYVTIFSVESGVLTSLEGPGILPSAQGNGIAFNSDGSELAVSNLGLLNIYDTSDLSLSNSIVLTTLGITTNDSLVWSPDDLYLIMKGSISGQSEIAFLEVGNGFAVTTPLTPTVAESKVFGNLRS